MWRPCLGGSDSSAGGKARNHLCYTEEPPKSSGTTWHQVPTTPVMTGRLKVRGRAGIPKPSDAPDRHPCWGEEWCPPCSDVFPEQNKPEDLWSGKPSRAGSRDAVLNVGCGGGWEKTFLLNAESLSLTLRSSQPRELAGLCPQKRGERSLGGFKKLAWQDSSQDSKQRRQQAPSGAQDVQSASKQSTHSRLSHVFKFEGSIKAFSVMQGRRHFLFLFFPGNSWGPYSLHKQEVNEERKTEDSADNGCNSRRWPRKYSGQGWRRPQGWQLCSRFGDNQPKAEEPRLFQQGFLPEDDTSRKPNTSDCIELHTIWGMVWGWIGDKHRES